MYIESLERQLRNNICEKEYKTYDNVCITARNIQKEIDRMEKMQSEDFIFDEFKKK
jgi:hypothetical protein